MIQQVSSSHAWEKAPLEHKYPYLLSLNSNLCKNLGKKLSCAGISVTINAEELYQSKVELV